MNWFLNFSLSFPKISTRIRKLTYIFALYLVFVNINNLDFYYGVGKKNNVTVTKTPVEKAHNNKDNIQENGEKKSNKKVSVFFKLLHSYLNDQSNTEIFYEAIGENGSISISQPIGITKSMQKTEEADKESLYLGNKFLIVKKVINSSIDQFYIFFNYLLIDNINLFFPEALFNKKIYDHSINFQDNHLGCIYYPNTNLYIIDLLSSNLFPYCIAGKKVPFQGEKSKKEVVEYYADFYVVHNKNDIEVIKISDNNLKNANIKIKSQIIKNGYLMRVFFKDDGLVKYAILQKNTLINNLYRSNAIRQNWEHYIKNNKKLPPEVIANACTVTIPLEKYSLYLTCLLNHHSYKKCNELIKNKNDIKENGKFFLLFAKISNDNDNVVEWKFSLKCCEKILWGE